MEAPVVETKARERALKKVQSSSSESSPDRGKSDEGKKSASGLVPVTKKHGADIKIGNTIQWNIDFLQMGVGGDTSWGRLVHPEYTIPADKNYSYQFERDNQFYWKNNVRIT